MAESIDIKAGVKSILERIEAAKVKRPEQVKCQKFPIDFLSL